MKDSRLERDEGILACGIVLMVAAIAVFTVLPLWMLDTENMSSRNIQKALVKYTIQCDLIYTGSPTTYEKYQGEKVCPADGRTSNGLSVEGIFPEHALLPFTRNNGERCMLYVPVSSSRVIAMVACKNKPNHFYLSTRVAKGDNNIIYVEARDEAGNALALLGPELKRF